MNFIKLVRIFLLVLIIIGVGLLATQKIWVPKLVEIILKNEKNSSMVYTDNKNNLSEVAPNFNDIFAVSGMSATFFEPDDKRIAYLKMQDGTESFSTTADDVLSQTSDVKDFLKTKKIKIYDTNKRYIKFLKDNGESFLIDRNSINALGWGIFLFDGKKSPLETYNGSIQDDYVSYFK